MKFFLSRKQSGIATLSVAVILLLVSTILVFAVAKSSIFDQKNVGDELRNRELHEAAKGALDYGLRMLRFNNISGWTNDQIGGTANPVPQPTAVTMSTGNTYDFTVTYTRMTDKPAPPLGDQPIFRVTAVATPTTGDTHLTRTVSTLALRANLLSGALVGAGPILVEGTLTDTKGTVEIVPGPNGAAVSSLTEGATIDTGTTDLHGGVISTSANGSHDMGLALFGIEDDLMLDRIMYTLSQQNPGKIKYVDGDYTLGNLPANFTSDGMLATIDVANPVNQHIIYFPRHKLNGTDLNETAKTTGDCPKLNGNPNIVGLVYVAIPGCDLNGWGGCNVYGTVALSGNVSDLNANCQFIGVDMSGLTQGPDSPTTVLVPVPGTWKDY